MNDFGIFHRQHPHLSRSPGNDWWVLHKIPVGNFPCQCYNMAASSSSESQNKAPTKEIELLEVSILKLPDLPLKGSTLEGETLGKPFGPCLDVTELFKPRFVECVRFSYSHFAAKSYIHPFFYLVIFPKRRAVARSLALQVAKMSRHCFTTEFRTLPYSHPIIRLLVYKMAAKTVVGWFLALFVLTHCSG